MKKKVLVSGIITIVFLILFIFTDPVYSVAGDGSIAKYLASNAEPGFNSVSWGIGAFLKIFVKIFPSVNWWTIFSIFMMFSSLFFLTLFVQELFDGVKGILVAVLFALFLWETAYNIDINFTQTAILSGITGTSAFLMLAHKIKGKGYIQGYDTCLKSEECNSIGGMICYGIVGALYILIAGGLRFDAMIMCVPFAMVILVLRFVGIVLRRVNDHTTIKNPGVSNDKRNRIVVNVIVPFALTICTVLVSYGSHQIYRHMNSDIAFFEDTFDLTRQVYDYIDMYPEYNEVKDVYEAAGLRGSWYAMLTNYYIADTNYFNVDTMSVPLQFKGASTQTFGGYMSEMLNYKGSLILGLLVMFLAGILTSLKKAIFPTLSAVVVFIVGGLYFVHVGRYAWRVSGGVTVACVVMGLMMLEEVYKRYTIISVGKAKADDNSSKIRMVVSCIVTVICSICVCIHIIDTKNFVFPRPKVTDEAKAGLLDYMDSNEDIIYFTEDYDYASHNIWYVGTPGYLDNKFTIFAGYNEGRSKDLQAVYINDMSQFVINMLTRDDIYTEYSDVWSSYLCDYYNPYVSAGIVDIYEPTGTQFIRYVAPVEATEDRFGDEVSDVALLVDGSKQTDNYQVVHIDAKTIGTDLDVEYYLNVEKSSTGAIYSYPLVRDGDVLSGDAIWKNDTWSFMDTNQYIVAKYPDGTIVRILNITGTPVPFN